MFLCKKSNIYLNDNFLYTRTPFSILKQLKSHVSQHKKDQQSILSQSDKTSVHYARKYLILSQNNLNHI